MAKKKTSKEPIYKTCRDIGKQLDDAIYVCGSLVEHGCKHALYNFNEDGSFGAMTLCLQMSPEERRRVLVEEECTNVRQYVGKVLGEK